METKLKFKIYVWAELVRHRYFRDQNISLVYVCMPARTELPTWLKFPTQLV